MKRLAVIPGSFDPMTTGHVSLVERTASLFEGVTVLVCINFDKSYTFTPEERLEIARASLEHLENVKVELYTGWLYEYLESHKPCVLVKGLRNEKDFAYEKAMADFNFEKCGVETLFLSSDKAERDTSSTKVRASLDSETGEISHISQNAQKLIQKFYAEKRKK